MLRLVSSAALLFASAAHAFCGFYVSSAGGIPEVPKTAAAKENRFQGRYIVRHPFDPNQCYRYSGGGAARGGFAPVQTALSGTQGKQAASTKLTAPFLSYLKSDIPELWLLAPKKK